jgi:N-acyl-D-aspartate/D-glutamate deacylase
VSTEYDLLIRGGTVVDGTGAARTTADIAVRDGVIVDVGRCDVDDAHARDVIDADGLLVTPGFVDIHTHYDAQVTWDDLLAPSVWHGVTTAILGNCGVGFAPVRPDRREWLVSLMESVEDIPADALHAGIPWGWESFPEYLDALERLPRAIDVGTQIPHGPLRTYVMDERGADNQPATHDDIVAMRALVADAMRAGALGFSTNRLPDHRAADGRPLPGTFATVDELLGIGRGMAEGGGGVLEIVSSGSMGDVDGGYLADVEWCARVSRDADIPVSFCLSQLENDPDGWRDVLVAIDSADRDGARLTAQVAGRPLGILIGLPTKHQFTGRAAYDEIAHLPVRDRAHAMGDPERRRRILDDRSPGVGIGLLIERLADRAFPLDDPPDYEPPPERSVAARAAREGRSVSEVFYDTYLEHDGERIVLFTLGGYAHRNSDHIVEMIQDRNAVLGLADGGAHCALICDASSYTTVLSQLVRDRTRGARLPLEVAVRAMTGGPAALYGLTDRGTIAPGRRADLNVIDLDRLAAPLPEVRHDFPAGAKRIVQRAEGYVATVVAGEVIQRDGVDTGARPGRVVRRRTP